MDLALRGGGFKFSRSKLAAYKIPRQVEFREQLPKTAVGKVLKRQLQAEQPKRR